MAISFPTSPTLNDLHKIGSTTYKWNGSSWVTRWQEHTAPASSLFNINTPPTSPNAFDDEFDSPTLDSKWVSITGGTPAATWTIRESCLTNTADNTDVVIYQPISGNTWKIQACMFAPKWFPNAEDGLMLAAHNSANSRTVEGGHWNSSGTVLPRVIRWNTNTTGFTATAYSGSYGGDEAFLTYSHDNYFELELATTTLTWRWSNTGLTNSWRDMYTESISSHLTNVPTHVGIRIRGIPCGLVDWIRRVA